MLVFLTLRDPAARDACRDYYLAHGCQVDAAADEHEAEALLRFRDYDLIVAELPNDEPHPQALELMRLAARRNPFALRVLLTTGPAPFVDEGIVVLTKPQRLDTILALAGEVRNTVREAMNTER